MPALQVRDFPDDLYVGLKEYAAQQHRSIAQQTICAVEEMLTRQEERANGKAARIISFESLREKDARIAKRRALYERIQEHARKLPENLPRPEDIMRESRDELEKRAKEIIARAEGIER